MLNKEELKDMIDQEYSIEEIAEKFGERHCAEDFGMESNQCCEDADCNKCWVDCLTLKIGE